MDGKALVAYYPLMQASKPYRPKGISPKRAIFKYRKQALEVLFAYNQMAGYDTSWPARTWPARLRQRPWLVLVEIPRPAPAPITFSVGSASFTGYTGMWVKVLDVVDMDTDDDWRAICIEQKLNGNSSKVVPF